MASKRGEWKWVVLLTQAGLELGIERGTNRLTMYFVVQSGHF